MDSLPPAVIARRPPTLQPAIDADARQWPTNFDLNTVEGRAGLLNAGNVADWIPSDRKDYLITAVNWVVYPEVFTDQETGEIKEGCVCVLIDRNGGTAKFSSDFAPRRLHAMIKMFTPEEWAKGIVIKCFTGQSRKQGRMYGSFKVLGLAE